MSYDDEHDLTLDRQRALLDLRRELTREMWLKRILHTPRPGKIDQIKQWVTGLFRPLDK